MGIGWLCSSVNDITHACFFFSIQHNPSFTKAETLAILTALLVAPTRAYVRIYTDSQAALSTFNNVIKGLNLSTRKMEKLANYQAWKTIRHIISTHALNIDIIKVKGHSGNFLNNKADSLAKQGCLEPKIDINFLNCPNSHLTFKNDSIMIENSIRNFWKQANQAQQFSKLLNLQRNADISA